MRLAARLRPDPLGELKHSPRPSSRNKGGLLLREGGGEGREGEGMGWKGRGGGRGEGREGDDFRHTNPEMLPAPLGVTSGPH